MCNFEYFDLRSILQIGRLIVSHRSLILLLVEMHLDQFIPFRPNSNPIPILRFDQFLISHQILHLDQFLIQFRFSVSTKFQFQFNFNHSDQFQIPVSTKPQFLHSIQTKFQINPTSPFPSRSNLNFLLHSDQSSPSRPNSPVFRPILTLGTWLLTFLFFWVFSFQPNVFWVSVFYFPLFLFYFMSFILLVLFSLCVWVLSGDAFLGHYFRVRF